MFRALAIFPRADGHLFEPIFSLWNHPRAAVPSLEKNGSTLCDKRSYMVSTLDVAKSHIFSSIVFHKDSALKSSSPYSAVSELQGLCTCMILSSTDHQVTPHHHHTHCQYAKHHRALLQVPLLGNNMCLKISWFIEPRSMLMIRQVLQTPVTQLDGYFLVRPFIWCSDIPYPCLPFWGTVLPQFGWLCGTVPLRFFFWSRDSCNPKGFICFEDSHFLAYLVSKTRQSLPLLKIFLSVSYRLGE